MHECQRRDSHALPRIAEEPTMRDDNEDTTIYKVVLNHEEQYSIWPADRDNPLGWRDAGRSGNKQECLEYIEQAWTDMRPLSLRGATGPAATK